MKANDKELSELLAQLVPDEQQAGQMEQDIRAGDSLLKAHQDPRLPSGMLDRAERVIRARRRRMTWHRSIARIAAALIIAVGVWSIFAVKGVFRASPGESVTIAAEDDTDWFDDEMNMWELVLIHGGEPDEQIDDLALTEVMLWWQETQLSSDDTIGKESGDENYTTDTHNGVCRRLV